MDNFGFQTSQASGTSGISGSGTTNYVSKFTAAATIGDSQIFDNGTNVGIGTSSPTTKLNVLGEGYFYNSATQYARIGGNQPAIYMDTNNYLAINPSGVGGVNIGANNTGVQLLSGIYNLKTDNIGVGSLASINVSDYLFKSYYDVSKNKFIINHSGVVGENYLGVNVDPTATAHIKGVDSTSANYSLKVENSASTSLLSVRNDGYTEVNSLSLGLGKGLVPLNVALGLNIFNLSTIGNENVAIGNNIMSNLTGAQGNTGIGHFSLNKITIGGYNIGIGRLNGFNLTDGTSNVLVGYETGGGCGTSASYNIGLGYQTLYSVQGNRNIAIGSLFAGYELTTGIDNLFIGTQNSGRGITTGSYNVVIGSINGLSTTLSNTIILGDGQGNERLRINSTGNVGIGTITPTSKLQVVGSDSTSSNFALKVENSTPTNLFSIRNDGVIDVYGTITPRLQSIVSSATITPTNLNDEVVITAQAVGLTLVNPTGTAVQGQSMIIRIKDNGTARTIAYDTQYRAIGVTLPTTTVINKIVYLGLIYNSTDTKWDVIGVSQEA